MAEEGASRDDGQDQLTLKLFSVNLKEPKGPDEHIARVEDATKNTREEVEALLEIIEIAKRRKQQSQLRPEKDEVVLHPSVVTPMKKIKAILKDGKSSGQQYRVTDENLLGEGAHGRVTEGEDPVTGKVYAKKTVALVNFETNEIRAWIHLNNSKAEAPVLYAFSLDLNNKEVVMKQELVEGKTIEQIVKSKGFSQMSMDDRKSISFIMLGSLLKTFKRLQEGGFTHGDIAERNVMISPNLQVFSIDYGLAEHKAQLEPRYFVDNLKSDMVSIIRVFLRFYALDGALEGIQSCHLKKALETYGLDQIQEHMDLIPEEDRKFLFGLISAVYNTVRDNTQEAFGDTSTIEGEIEEKISRGKDFEELQQRVVALLFPERYPNPNDGLEADGGESEGETILDDPALADVATLVNLRRDFGELFQARL